MDAVLIAGGRVETELAQAAGQNVKALFRFGDKPCVQQVLDALWAAGIERVALVGNELLLQGLQADPERLFYVSEGSSPVENLLKGIERLGLQAKDRFLQCASDLPLITSESVRAFIQALPESFDVRVSFVPEQAFRSHYPDCPYTGIRFREGLFVSGSISALRVGFLKEQEPFIQRFVEARKCPRQSLKVLAGHLGWRVIYPGLPVILSYLRGQLSAKALEPIALKALGIRLSFDLEAGADLAFDIDTLEDFQSAHRHFEAERARR